MRQRKNNNMEDLVVTEGIAGVWFYHLSHWKTYTTSLCGRDTMMSPVNLKNWGKSGSNTPDKWCKECEKLAGKGFV